MNVKQLDTKKLVATIRNLRRALYEAQDCLESIDYVIKTNVKKDSKLNYLYEKDET